MTMELSADDRIREADHRIKNHLQMVARCCQTKVDLSPVGRKLAMPSNGLNGAGGFLVLATWANDRGLVCPERALR